MFTATLFWMWTRKSGLAIACLIMGLVLSTSPPLRVQAAVLVANDATSLIAAINSANSTEEADTIILTDNVLLTTAIEQVGGVIISGLPFINTPITINGSGFSIERDGSLLCDESTPPINKFRIFYVLQADLTLENISVRNGCARDNRGGGGIFNDFGTVTIKNSTLSGNSTNAVSHGGGIRQVGGTLRISNSTVSGNSAWFGGGIASLSEVVIDSNSTVSGNSAFRGGGIFNWDGTVTITDSALSNNTALGDGGGILSFAGTLDIINSAVSNNTGGGINVGGYDRYGNLNTGMLTISNNSAVSNNIGGGINISGTLIISNNSAVSNNTGGGIRNNSGGQVAITNSAVSNNTGGGAGGGINNPPGGQVAITSSTLSGNTAGQGGGIYNGGTMTISDSTVSGNSVLSDGGGVVTGGGIFNGDTLSISNSTVSGNTASSGGGIYNIGAMIITSSTLTGNMADSGSGIFNEGTTTIRNSIVTSTNGGDCLNTGTFNTFNNLATGACGTIAVTNLDSILRDNGGPTETHALLADSNAIDAAFGCPPPSTDQRGEYRPQGNRCDIGAYESPFSASCSDIDQDGVCDVEEASGPNLGDSNSDGILDSEQAHVASLLNVVDGEYVTLIAESSDPSISVTFQNVLAAVNPSPGDTPPGVEFPIGFFEYEIQCTQDPPQDPPAPCPPVTVTMLPPPDFPINTFYKYGPTLSNTMDHWYPFGYQFSSNTGAEFYDDDNNGDTDRIVLHFVDGQRGDDDLLMNGRIVEPGAPGYVVNAPPVADAGEDQVVDEGSTIQLSAAASNDPDGDSLEYAWTVVSYTGPAISLSDANVIDPTFDTYDNGQYTFEVTVSDPYGHTVTDQVTVTVNNVAPVIQEIVASQEPYQVDTSVSVTATYTDAGVEDTHTATWDWGDHQTSDGTITGSNGSFSVEGEHFYTTPGVFVLTLTVVDDDTGLVSAAYQYVVTYDPSAGFVTGGGWIDSPPGAYTPDPTLVGKANFGFVAKYLKGALTPTGETEFRFKVAALDFHSDTYDWLVVNRTRAQFKGTGTINGMGDYGFMLTAFDSAVTGDGDADKFRIKIWDKTTDTIIYDNQLGDDDNANLNTVIAGGNIIVHSSKELTIVESDDSLVKQSGTWTPFDTPAASGGSYLSNNIAPTDRLIMAFKGASLEIVYVQHPALGTFVIEVDGEVVQTVDSAGKEKFGQVSEVRGLEPGSHLVRIYGQNDGDGVAIDAFAVEAPLTIPTFSTETVADPVPSVAAGLVRIEADTAAVQQDGGWINFNASSASGGSYLYSSGNESDTLSLDFTGTQVAIIYTQHSMSASFVIEVDGIAVGAVSVSDPVGIFGWRTSVTDLSFGQHTVRIVPLEGNIAIDAFEVEAAHN